MGFLIFAGKKMGAIGSGIGGFLLGLGILIAGAIARAPLAIGLGVFVLLLGFIAGVYLWRRADREVGFKIT